MASTEHGGSERATVFECAQFGGSFTRPNQVYAYQSPTSLGGVPSWIVTREPNELYVSGGAASLALPGPFFLASAATSSANVLFTWTNIYRNSCISRRFINISSISCLDTSIDESLIISGKKFSTAIII
ncbi:MAG: hypothetical protein WBX01_10770 [Nitrososphaeraceae archaeon]